MDKSVRQEVKGFVIEKAMESRHFELSLVPADAEDQDEMCYEKLVNVIKPLFLMSSKCFISIPKGMELQVIIETPVASKVKGAIQLSIQEESIESLKKVWLSDESVNTRGSIVLELNNNDSLISFFNNCYNPTIVTNIASVIGKSLSRKLKGKIEDSKDLVFVVFPPDGIKKVSIYSNKENVRNFLEHCYKYSHMTSGYLNTYGESS